MGAETTGNELPILLRAEEAAKLLSLGRTTIFAMMASGELPCVRMGRAVRVPRVALERWVQERSAESGHLPGPRACYGL